MDSKFDNVSPGCYRITIGFNDDTSLIRDYQTRLNRDRAWNDLIETIGKGEGVIIYDDQDNKVMVFPQNIKYIRMNTVDLDDVKFGKTRLIGHDEIAPCRTTVGSYNLYSGEFSEDVECDDCEGEVDEGCISDCRCVDLIDAVEDFLYAGDTDAAIRLLDFYLLKEDCDDRMARRLRDSIANVASASEHTSMDVDMNRRNHDAHDDEIPDESMLEPNIMAYRAIIKMVSGRCLAKDFDSKESAKDWLVQNNLFGMRKNMDGTLGCLLDDDFHYFDINPENVDYITAGPKPRFDEFLAELSEITE